MAKIYSPVKDFTGSVVGVTFTKGEAETSNKTAIAYFTRQGYQVGSKAKKTAPKDMTFVGKDGAK